MTPPDRLAATFRRLLRCYPRAWRRRHEDEMLAVLLDGAEADGRTTAGPAVVLDLVGHGLEARVDAVVHRLPERFRRRTATVALVVTAALSLLLLGGEGVAARFRPPADEVEHFGASFLSGPFMTIGVGLYLACLSAALLVVLARPGWARLLLLLAAAAFSAWMALTGGGPYPVPRLSLLVMFVGLGLLASLTTLDLGRPTRRRLVTAGAGLVGALAVGLLLTRPLLGWSVGTMATSGNVALAALAVVLAVVGLLAIVGAAAREGRHPGWSAALAVTAVPVVLFCTATSIAVNPTQAPVRVLIPPAYLVVAIVVALVRRRLDVRPAGR